jgi:hypothetical protein
MKTVSVLVCLVLIGSPLLAQAETAQQQRMADCSAKNKGKKGDDYKAAQKACLSGKTTTPQERMKQCNADAGAKQLKGDARKAFMSGCLKAA